MFDATKSKFRDVEFQKVDVDQASSADLVVKYSAQRIPKAVFLDGGGKELYNGGCPQSEEGFTSLINQYR